MEIYYLNGTKFKTAVLKTQRDQRKLEENKEAAKLS